MVDARVFTGGLNQDTADEFLQQGDYRYALNIDPGPDGVTKLLGNVGLTSLSSTPSGTNWVCGSHFDKTRQRVFYFIFNSVGYHRIVSVAINTISPDNSTSTILFEDRTDTGGTSILGWHLPGNETSFTPTKMIKDVKIIYRGNGSEGDLVYFIDPLKRPLKFNTLTLPTLAATNDVILDYFKVIKAPPKTFPNANYIDSPGRSINNLYKKLFQFKYRYVYDDDEKSVWSASSPIVVPPKSNDIEYYADGTKANAIILSVNTSNKIIKKIELSARVNVDSTWSNYFLIETFNKQELNLSDNQIYQYTFFNDGAYLPLETEESNLLFDYVPDKANALELANGNTLVFGGIEEGLDRDTTITTSIVITNGAAANFGAVEFLSKPQELYPTTVYTYNLELSGFVTTGDAIQLKFYLFEVSSQTNIEFDITYNVLSSDTIVDVANGLISIINGSPSNLSATLVSGSNSFAEIEFTTVSTNYEFQPDVFNDGNSLLGFFIPTTGNTLGADSLSCLKWGGRYSYGIVYYDKNGKTNGVLTDKTKQLTVDIPRYSETSSVANISTVEIRISNAPPSWAEYYHVVRTKELTSSFSKFFVTKGADITTDPSYPLINIQNLVLHGTTFPTSSSIINYTATSFVKGDRIRFIKTIGGSILSPQPDYEILGVVIVGGEQYIKIKSVTGMPTITASTKFLIEIYRPAPVISQNSLNFYYEIGESYPIYTDNNGNRAHRGNAQNQIIGAGSQSAKVRTRSGDYYVKSRTLITGGTASSTTSYTCMDAHFSDFWESAVWGQGRALVIDESAKTQYFPALLRFSQSYIQGTNINNLNRFYPENFEEADNSFGDILRLKTRENFIRMFQRYKVGMIPIYRSIIVDTANSTQVGISEKLLNLPNYYAGEYGIDKYGSSLVSTDYGDYFIDSINRAIIRVSLDGMTNISDTYNMAAYSNGAINEGSYGYGYFNYETRSVVILIGTIGQTPSIISYSESRKNFESFHGYTNATSFQFVNGILWSFYVKPYVHNQSSRNNFYGVQQSCSISTVFNGNVQLKKTYMAIELLSTELWTSSMQTGPLLNQQTTIDAVDYTKTVGAYTIQNKENKYNATIKRDTTSAGGKYFGDSMKGNFAQVTFFNSTDNNSRLISVSLKYIQSPLTNS
jgi:hypothetical protein